MLNYNNKNRYKKITRRIRKQRGFWLRGGRNKVKRWLALIIVKKYSFIYLRLKASQKGDYDHVKKCLDKKANPLVECKKKWNPIIWAACRGWTKIVRLLISRGGI